MEGSGLLMKSSNASAAAFGWDFQSNAAIMFMLKNIRAASAVKVEGATEDIEITLNNGKVIFSQAKSVFKPDDYTHVTAKLQAGLKTLNEAAKKPNVERLIYVTNSPNPFNDTKTMWAFSGGLTTLNYNELPDICREKVEELYHSQGCFFDRDQFSVYVMQFHGDGENRYKIVKDLTNEFLASIGIGDRGLGTQILEIWQRSFSMNSSQHELTASITKRQMIWPLIVSICYIDKEDALLADCDDGEFDEIRRKYSAVINNNAERFEFVTKVMMAYNSYEPSMISRERTKKFIEKHWSTFRSEFDAPNMASEALKVVIKLAVSNVIKRRGIIADVKRGVNL
jgi:hypothetical protein